MEIGKERYSLAERLFPTCRGITGNGVRETVKTYEVPTGTKVFD